jgi:hypothetical protein
MQSAGSMNSIGSSGVPMMQSTGHAAMQDASFTPKHFSVITKVTASFPA